MLFFTFMNMSTQNKVDSNDKHKYVPKYVTIQSQNGPVSIDINKVRESMRYAMSVRKQMRASDKSDNHG